MRTLTRCGLLTLIFLALALPGLATAQGIPGVPGPGAVSPAPADAVPAPATNLPPVPPRGYVVDIGQAKVDAEVTFSATTDVYQVDPGTTPRATRTMSVSTPVPEAPALGTNFAGVSYTLQAPPDSILAAGPSSIIVMTNGNISIKSKTGTLVASTTLDSFFATVRSVGENAFDPKVIYDHHSGRYFALAVGTNFSSLSHWYVAVSKDSNPTTITGTSWYFYAFDATVNGPANAWADYPQIGVDANVIVLTANMFGFFGGYGGAKIRVIQKTPMLTGGATTFTDFVNPIGETGAPFEATLQPALTFGTPGTFFLVASSIFTNSCQVVVFGIANPSTSPTLSSKTVNPGGTCGIPPDALQAGSTTAKLDTADTRLYNAVFRNNSIWAAHTIASGSESAVRWFQVNLSNWPTSISLTQNATFGAPGIFYFYPGLMVDANDNMAMVFARSSSTESGSVWYTARNAGDPVNTLQPAAVLKAGSGTYVCTFCGSTNRWGDYSGIALDPSDGSFWIHGEYYPGVAVNAWATWVGNFVMVTPTPDLVVSAISAPSTGAAGQPLAVTNTIQNIGTATAAASTVRFYLSSDTTLDLGSDVLLTPTRAIAALAAGATSGSAATSLTIPGNVSPGTYYILAFADALGVVGESDETNNVGATAAIDILRPDLAPTAVSSSASTTVAGGALSITNTITNIGGAPTVAGASTARLWLSTAATLGVGIDISLATRSVPSLAANVSSTAITAVVIPGNVSQGAYFIIVEADSANVIAEADENNNTAATPISVLLPDLSVPSVTSSSANTVAGGVLSITNTIKNIAGAPTVAAASTAKLWLSTASTLAAGTNVALTTRAVPSLAANVSSTAVTPVTIPLATPEGSYYIIVQADSAGVVNEANETNNEGVTAGQVAVIRPNLAVTAVTATPSPVATGGTLSVTNTVKNVAPAPTVAGASTAKLWLSTASTLGGGTNIALGTRAVPSLAANVSSTAITPVVIPANVSAGAYYVIVQADSTNAVAEANEGDNEGATAGQVTVVRPDLTVGTVSASAANTVAGGALTITNTVRNTGPAPSLAPSSTAKLWLSTATTLGIGTDIALATRAVPSLAANVSSTVATPVVIPLATPEGSYYLIAQADSTGVVFESNEGNNTGASVGQVAVIRPNLAVPAVSAAPLTVRTGGTLNVTNTVKNVAAAPTVAAASTAKLWLSTANTLGGGANIALGTRAVPSLAANVSSTAVTPVVIPANVSAGAYYIIVQADSTGVVSEANEGDNEGVTAGQVTVVRPDLTVGTVSPSSANAVTGGALTITNTVRNTGPAPSLAPASTAKLWLSTATTLGIGTDIALATRAVPSLAANVSSTVATPVVIPLATPEGSYYLIAQADSTGVVFESNEGNNTGASVGQVAVIRPNLAVPAVTAAPLTVRTGGTLNVTNTVKNVAPAPTVAGASTARLWLSTANTLGGGTNIALGTRAVPSLAANVSSTAITPVVIPANVSAGAYYVIVQADSTNGVAEANEGDNEGVTAGQVTVVRPDLTVGTVNPSAVNTVAGGALTITNTVWNTGLAPSLAAASTAKLWLSTATTLGVGTDIALGTRAVPSLAANVSSTAATPVVIPLATPEGSYYLIVQADSTNVVFESEEGNNTGASVGQVAVIRPNLAVTAVTATPSPVATGGTLNVTNTVKNVAPAPTVAGASAAKLWLSTASTLGGGTNIALGTRAVPSLAANVSSTAITPVVIPANTSAGSYYVIVQADSAGVVSEADEGDNEGVTVAQVAVLRPDLTVPAVTLSNSTAIASKTLVVTNTVRNVAPAPTIAPPSTARIWLSTAPALGIGTDVPLLTRAVPSLAANVSSTMATTVTIPANTSAGSYDIIVTADSANVVAESSEANNAASVPVDVVPNMVRSGTGSLFTDSTGCTFPENNGDSTDTVAFSITNQTTTNPTSWQGHVSLGLGGVVVQTLTLPGTVDSLGNIAGTFSFVITGLGTTVDGHGTFTGTATGSTFFASITGGFDHGETCTFTGSLSAPPVFIPED